MAMSAWKAEKSRLRESMLQGVQPPSLKHELASATLFCEGLFPEKRFKELDAEYADKHNICDFPALSLLSGNVKRKPDQQVANPTARKKSKPSVPAPAMPAGKGKQVNARPPVASQSQPLQGTSRKGKA